MIAFILFVLLPCIKVNIAQNIEPTRTIDLWDPFGTTTTRRPGLVSLFVMHNGVKWVAFRIHE